VTSQERLILEVWTDGTISPIDAVSKAAQILVEKFQLFYELSHVPQRVGGISPEQYNMPIEQLILSVRTFNCLKRAGITRVGELLERSEEELLKIKNLGQKALEEVREQLKVLGFVSEENEIPRGEAALEEEDLE
jgi:DNA-directed RNA polymerase subunit alpha